MKKLRGALNGVHTTTAPNTELATPARIPEMPSPTEMRKKSRSHSSRRIPEMTQATVQLIINMIQVENALCFRADREGALLAAAISDYRRRLETKSGFVRVQPDRVFELLKFVQIKRGNGWVKWIDTRVKSKKTQSEARLPSANMS